MASLDVSFIIFTVIFGVVAFICPIVMIPFKNPNKGVIQLMLMLTGVSCWLFWLCCYMTQLNPLIGPKLSNHTILMISQNWGNSFD